MKVLVLGAGVIGTCTAWYLTQQGHEVTVADRRDAPGMETSFANGGQISAGHAEPWANPDAPKKIAQWILRDDAPLLFRPRMDPAQWSWGIRFLLECTPASTRENIGEIVKLAVYSRETLQELRAQTGIHYDELQLGILHYYTRQGELDRAIAAARVMREHGLDLEVKTVDEAVKIEPALAAARDKLVGATFSPSDESGDAHVFTQRLAKMAEEKGAKFIFGRRIEALVTEGNRIHHVKTSGEPLRAHAYVVALGSYSPLLTRAIGLSLPVYPAKGYSASIPVVDESKAPRVSLTDDEAKIVISRLGNRIRVAGTAELSGYSTELDRVRCRALTKRMAEIFPGAGDYDTAAFWTGLRPSTPSNVPLVGRTGFENLYLNTGHGTLGWTMAAGSGKALADIMSGREPEVDFKFTR